MRNGPPNWPGMAANLLATSPGTRTRSNSRPDNSRQLFLQRLRGLRQLLDDLLVGEATFARLTNQLLDLRGELLVGSLSSPIRKERPVRKSTKSTQPISTAPHDGTPVRVLQGRWQLPKLAYWHRGLRGWIACDDPLMCVLHQVTEWVPGNA